MPAGRGTPLQGSRAAHDVDELLGALHGSDLEAAAPTVHNPLPGAAGEIVTSDGSKWTSAAPVVVAHDILSASHGDAAVGAVVDGDVIIGNVTPAWSRLAISVPGAGIVNVLGVVQGELRPSWKSSSSNPGASVSLLATDASGHLQLVRLGLGAAPTEVLQVSGNVWLDTDSNKLYLGAGKDVELYYDGTKLCLASDLVAPSDIHIDAGTDKTIVLDETVWDDLPPSPIIGAKLGSSAPTLATFVTDVEQYTFDNTNDYVIGATEIIHTWKEGTSLYPHIHWATNGSEGTAKGVQWRLKYTIGDANEAFSAQASSVIDVTIPASTTDRTHFVSDFSPAIDGTNLKIGAYICWRLERIATAHVNGEPAADPFALAIGFHGEMDTVGSRQRYIK